MGDVVESATAGHQVSVPLLSSANILGDPKGAGSHLAYGVKYCLSGSEAGVASNMPDLDGYLMKCKCCILSNRPFLYLQESGVKWNLYL